MLFEKSIVAESDLPEAGMIFIKIPVLQAVIPTAGVKDASFFPTGTVIGLHLDIDRLLLVKDAPPMGVARFVRK